MRKIFLTVLLALAFAPAAVLADMMSCITLNPAGDIVTGQNITVIMNVSNLSSQNVYNIIPDTLVKLGSGDAFILSGPAPASMSLAGTQSGGFTWVYMPNGEGTLSLTGYASGWDELTGNTVTSYGACNANYISITYPTATASVTETRAPSGTFTRTLTPTYTVTRTITVTPTRTSTVPSTATAANTGTFTRTVTTTYITGSPMPSSSPTYTVTVTRTITVTPTYTVTCTISRTPTLTSTNNLTSVVTATMTNTVAPSETPEYGFYPDNISIICGEGNGGAYSSCTDGSGNIYVSVIEYDTYCTCYVI